MNDELWKDFEETGSIKNYLSYKSNIDNKLYSKRTDKIDGSIDKEESHLPNNLR